MQTALLISLLVYLVIMIGIALWAKTQIKDEEDFIVAGRRLPLSLSMMTLLATWFGAGTLLTATDEIRSEGLRVAALEPYGAGVCLILAGIFFATPLWEMKIVTLADFWAAKYGPVAEVFAVVSSIPGFVGWIAVQLVALAGILQVFFDIPLSTGILIVAGVAMFYTLLGGMWSVTVTDAAQLVLMVIGLGCLGYSVFASVGDGSIVRGMMVTVDAIPPERLNWLPAENLSKFFGWLNLFLVASLGNIPGQDLAQRIFAAKSSKVAKRACIWAGVLYIVMGTIPVSLGLVAGNILPEEVTHSVLPALAERFLSPAMTIVFVLTLVSVVLSTIDSAILAPAPTLAKNGFRKFIPQRISTLAICHFCVVLITALSVVVAFSGQEAFDLLESSYALGLAGFFIPFAIGILFRGRNGKAAVGAILFGTVIWCLEYVVDTELPMAMIGMLSSGVFYYLINELTD